MIHKSTVLLLISGVCLGGDVVLSPGPVYGTVGGSVWINTTISRTDKDLRYVEWKFTWKVNNKQIVTSSGNNTIPEPDYDGRVKVDTHTGSLQLLNLTLRDSGTYTVTIFTTEHDSALKGTMTLEVFEVCLGSEPVPGSVGKHVWINTTLSPATEPLSLIKWTVKGQHIVTLNSGQIDPEPVYRDRVRLDRHTGSLELLNVTMSDSGEYTVTIRKTTEDPEIKCRTVLNVSGKESTGHRDDGGGGEDGGIGGGVKAGIVGGGVIVGFGIGGLIVYLRRKKHASDQTETTKDKMEITRLRNYGNDQNQHPVNTNDPDPASPDKIGPNEQDMTPYSPVNANEIQRDLILL